MLRDCIQKRSMRILLVPTENNGILMCEQILIRKISILGDEKIGRKRNKIKEKLYIKYLDTKLAVV